MTVSPSVLAQFPSIHAAIPAGLRAPLASALTERALSAGEVLVAEGSHGSELFLVLEGELEATVRTPGGTVSLGRIGQGERLGETFLFSPGPSRFGASAVGPARVLVLTHAALHSLGASATPLVGLLTRELAQRARTATDVLRRLQERPDADPPAGALLRSVLLPA